MRERAALVTAAALPAWRGHRPAPPLLQSWFARYRPEPGRPWLLAHGPGRGVVGAELLAMIAAVGVPVHRADRAPEASWARLVVAFELHAWPAPQAARVVEVCLRRELTLVATAAAPPFPDAGEGLESSVGEEVALAILEESEVVAVD